MEKKADSKNKETQQEKEFMAGEQDQQAGTNDNMSPEEQIQEEEAVLDMNQEMLDRIKELEAKVAEANEKHLRLFSEFDNYRKRTTRERIELLKSASAEMITALLPVVDDLERASSIAAAEAKGDAVAEGVTLILNKLKAILSQKGVEEIKANGEEFNTDYHEAITHIPATDKSQKGKVVEVIQKGYMLNEKVIRFARVVVAN
ncbi:MAG: nucleotide exchange factor GrpE [Bacteroidales bacterium]|nr:nucleotide exchange factor GrpE [Bacteroidales bacterium]